MPNKASEKDEEKRRKDLETEHFTVSNWQGYDNYECNYCAFACAEIGARETMEAHLKGMHANPTDSGLVVKPQFQPVPQDRYGNPLPTDAFDVPDDADSKK